MPKPKLRRFPRVELSYPPMRELGCLTAMCFLVGCSSDEPSEGDRSASGGQETTVSGGQTSRAVGGSSLGLGGSSKTTAFSTPSGGASSATVFAGGTTSSATGGTTSSVTGGTTSSATGGTTSSATGGTTSSATGGTTVGGNHSGGSASGGSPTGGTASAGGSTQSSTGADVIANFENGIFWNDVTGKRIEAHGGGFLLENGTWYWFGEDKSHNSGNFKAVNCYSSTNLEDWQFRRAIITRTTAPELNTTDRIIERPKVIYNEKTKRYVMWLHWEGQNYAEAAAGVFSSDTVDGNYRFESSFRPNKNMSRDDTLFKDDDGKAYFLSAANENADLVLYELSEDYLTVARQAAVLWPGASREAPALFKSNGRYYLITSGCTGWDPNQAEYATATSITGPWSARAKLGNGTTYDSQSTFVLPIKGSKTTTYVYVGDRWQDPDLLSSKYIFLPLKLDGTSLTLDYYETWQLNLTTGSWTVNDGYVPQDAWTVKYVDSEETSAENGRGSRAFDNSSQTFWHTQYTDQKPDYPHELQIDLGDSYVLEGFRYLPRQDKDPYGMVAKFEFYVSETATDFGSPVATGTFADTRSPTVTRFTKKTGRYIRFVALSSIGGEAYASVAELDVIGTRAVP